MTTLSFLATAIGLGASAGLNAWATLLVFGVIARLQPSWFPGDVATFFASTPVLIALAVVYLVEFVADKVPTVDHAWDVIQTVIRPLAGAVVAYASASDTIDTQWVVIASIAAGGTALGSHLGKSGTRLASTAGTGGLANPILSVIEDVVAVGQAILAILFPLLALLVVVLLFAMMAMLVFRMRRRRRTA